MRIGYGTSVTVPSQQERWFSEMRAGRTFGRGAIIAGVAATFAQCQLFNPVASGITVLVYRAAGSSVAADTMQVRQHNTALATLIGSGFNLLSGAAASVAEIRSSNPAAQDGTIIGPQQVLATTTLSLGEVWMTELGPGEGLLVANNTLNTTTVVNFFWNEA